jgi:hypothetical protein
MGKRDVAADLFIALMKAESPEQVHAVSTVVAVMLAKGCVALALGWKVCKLLALILSAAPGALLRSFWVLALLACCAKRAVLLRRV